MNFIKAKRKYNLFRSFIKILNVVAAICLILSYLASYISSGPFWLISFFGISFPILFAVNFLFALYWSISADKWLLLSLLTILFGYNNLRELIQFNIISPEINTEKSIKIMTYNVRLFDHYKLNAEDNSNSRIFQLIKNENPDVLCIQEFYTSNKEGEVNNIDSISENLQLGKKNKASLTELDFMNDKNVFFGFSENSKGKRKRGMAIFSKFPILNRGKLNLKSNKLNTAIYCDVKMGTDTVRIYNVHLQSIRFQKQDYQFMENINKSNENANMKDTQEIFEKLRNAFIKRAMQADLLKNHIQNSPYKVIVCGDFNDTPSSYAYNTISNNLKDAFIESGSGFSQTYSGIFPSFRIDYILFDNAFKGYGYKTIRKNFSDHYPVISHVQLSGK